jgi:hypothetical protein
MAGGQNGFPKVMKWLTLGFVFTKAGPFRQRVKTSRGARFFHFV